MIRGRPLSFLMGVKGHLGSPGVKRLKTSLTQYLKVGKLDGFHTWYGVVLWLEDEPDHFWWGSKVIWGYWGSNA